MSFLYDDIGYLVQVVPTLSSPLYFENQEHFEYSATYAELEELLANVVDRFRSCVVYVFPLQWDAWYELHYIDTDELCTIEH